MEKLYVSDIIEKPGGMRFSIKILAFIGLAMIFDGFDYMIVSFTMPQITAEMELGMIETGSLASFSVLGMIIGGFIAGYLADIFGRKHVMNVSIMVYAILTVPIFFVTTYDAFALCRIFSGIGVGAVIPLSVTIVSEYAPTKYRATFVTITKAFMMLGWVIAGLVAMYVVPNLGWRFCFLIGGFPFLYGILMYKLVPESVQWLLSKGKNDEALQVINRINAQLDNPKEGGYTLDEIIMAPADEQKGTLKQVVSKKYIKVTMGIWLVAFATCALSYGLTNWMPTMLVNEGYSVTASYGYTTLMNLLGCCGAIVAGIGADKLGRIRNVYVAVGLAALSVLFMAFFGFGGLIVPACIMMGFAINYAYMTPAPITIEAYPTEIRGTAQACVTTVARLGGLVTPIAIGWALQTGSGFTTVMIIFLVPLALAAVFTKVFIKTETKGMIMEKLGD